MSDCNCGFDIPAGGRLAALTLTNALAIASGGTGANTADGARTALGIEAGTNCLTIGGILIQWGYTTINISGMQYLDIATSGVVTFPTAFDALPCVFVSVKYEQYTGFCTYNAGAITTSNFRVYATNLSGSTSGMGLPLRDVFWVAFSYASA